MPLRQLLAAFPIQRWLVPVGALLLLVLASACESRPDVEPSSAGAKATSPPAKPSSSPTRDAAGPSIAFQVAKDWKEPVRSDDTPPSLRGFFEPGRSFQKLGKPKPGDWLAEHPENGQTFAQFVASRPNLPTEGRHILYIVPFEAWDPAARGPSLRDIAEYVSLFFGLTVRVTHPDARDLASITSRIHQRTGKRQLLTRDILDLLSRRIPSDAYAVMALTHTDLYPQASWNYVFGEAMIRKRVAVHSLARYSPGFLDTADVGDEVLKRRILGVSAHEIGHMFGLEHCTAHRCVLNGANSLEETDRGPMHACPVCLRKLHHSTGFAPDARYRALRGYYERAGLDDEGRPAPHRSARRRLSGAPRSAASAEALGGRGARLRNADASAEALDPRCPPPRR